MKKKIMFSIVIVLLVLSGLLFVYEMDFLEGIKNNIGKRMEENTELVGVTKIDVTNLSNNGVIEHEHVYKTMYDENKHWEECIICKQRRNEIVHNYTTTWAFGYESCNNYGNSYTKACECGYSEIGHKPCVWSGKYHSDYNIHRHDKICSVCNTHIANSYWSNGKLYKEEKEDCHLSNGTKLTCQTLGRCVVCNYNYTTRIHYLIAEDESIKCKFCDTEFGIISKTVTRDENSPGTYKTVTNFKLKNGAKYNSIIGISSADGYLEKNVTTLTKGSVGSTDVTTTTIAKFKPTFKEMTNRSPAIYVNINGVVCWLPSGSDYEYYPDLVAPTITDITCNNSNEIIEWGKSKSITINGTENYCDNVIVEILDEEENILFSGKAVVNNGIYSISCIPELEAGLEGKNFRVIVTDTCENKVEKEFIISKIDAIAPTITSELEVSNEWAKSKQITFSATDSGIGNVSIAFNDIEDLALANFDGEKYYRNYEFVGDVYSSKQLSVLYKDELGNTSMQKVSINKIDNTAPTIISGRIHNNKLIMTANDAKEGIGDGSGVAKYRYVTSEEKLYNPEVLINTGIEVTASEEIVVDNISNVKYAYIVAEDLVRKC
ncbi:MAG: hypothetical protein HFJ25_02445 [Clostridia bacterium]|nr:hypothetical protein [Clostridia bacterium]